jgi:hypothetical protein
VITAELLATNLRVKMTKIDDMHKAVNSRFSIDAVESKNMIETL